MNPRNTKPTKDTSPELVGGDYPKPSALELAKLAALVAPGAQPRAALTRAMVLYTEALKFVGELPATYTLEELVGVYGGSGLMDDIERKVQSALDANDRDVLRYEPEAPDDPARQFLATLGIKHLKTPRAVLGGLKEFLIRTAQCSPKDAGLRIKSWKHQEEEVYSIPRDVLHGVAVLKKHRASTRATKAVVTRRAKAARKHRQRKPSLSMVR